MHTHIHVLIMASIHNSHRMYTKLKTAKMMENAIQIIVYDLMVKREDVQVYILMLVPAVCIDLI